MGQKERKYEPEEYAKDEDEEFSCLSLSLCVCVIKKLCVCLYVFMNCVTLLRVRIANPMVMDSYCRGGIVCVRFGCSRVRPEYGPRVTKALWRFRVSI